MRTPTVIALAIGIGAATAGAGAFAHDGDHMPAGKVSAATKAAYARHENFEKMGKAFKVILDEIRKSDADKAAIAANAKTIAALANGLPGWFPKGSGTEARPKSEAKPNIWTDAAGFSAKASAMQVQASKLNQVAASGDMNAIRSQVRALGGTCKGCHDTFRQEKKD